MKSTHPILLVAVCGALAALGWLALRSADGTRKSVDPESTSSLGAPAPEKLAALDAAETQSAPSVEAGPTATRAAIEVRTINTPSASIRVLPPKVANENRGMIIVWCYLALSHADIEPKELTLLAADGKRLKQQGTEEPGNFRGLATGIYSVLVQDPRFEDVRIDGVPTGSHVLIDLIGMARVRPLAFDAETGESIAAGELRLAGYGEQKSIAPDAQGWFAGLPAGDLALTLSAPGYEPTLLQAADLRAGESREVMVRFPRTGLICGIVLASESGEPLADVQVQLTWLDEDPLRIQMRSRISLTGGRLVPSFPVSSDEQGRFQFEGLAAGSYRVEAQAPTFQIPAQEVTLRPGALRADLRLVAPELCTLSGRLEAAGASTTANPFGNLAIGIQPLGQRRQSFADLQLAQVQLDGRFRFGEELPVGRVSIVLVVLDPDRSSNPRPGSPATRVLGELALHGGENECTYDVSSLVPGEASIEVVAEGFRLEGGRLLVAAREGGTSAEAYAFDGSSGQLGPLPPGDYLVLAQGARGEWMASTPVALHIASGASTSLRIDLRLVQGRMRIEDEQGASLPEGLAVGISTRIQGWPGGAAEIGVLLGEDGSLALALAPGTYALRSELIFGREDPGAIHTFEWTGSGPAQPVLRLPAK